MHGLDNLNINEVFGVYVDNRQKPENILYEQNSEYFNVISGG
jgi:hypothetical protein